MALSRYTWRTFCRELALIVVALIFMSPVYLLVVVSLKSSSDAILAPFAFPKTLEFGNYPDAWGSAGEGGLGAALVTTAIITVASVVGLILVGSLGAYVLARRNSKLSTAVYIGFTIGIILPFQLAVIPLYAEMRDLGLVGNYLGMILLYIGMLTPLSVFLYTGFIRSLPRDYEEAARVDGARLLRVFIRVVFPLLRPVTGTVAVLTGVIIWNDFFAALIFLAGSDYQTLPLSLYRFVGESVSQWNLIFAAVIITILPVLIFYLVAQRQLMRGFAGGIRG